ATGAWLRSMTTFSSMLAVTSKVHLRISLAFLLGSAAFADTYPRQTGIDAIHYVFRLTLTDASDEISGEATADLRFVKDGVTQFWLDLASVADGRGMAVFSGTCGGRVPA